MRWCARGEQHVFHLIARGHSFCRSDAIHRYPRVMGRSPPSYTILCGHITLHSSRLERIRSREIMLELYRACDGVRGWKGTRWSNPSRVVIRICAVSVSLKVPHQVPSVGRRRPLRHDVPRRSPPDSPRRATPEPRHHQRRPAHLPRQVQYERNRRVRPVLRRLVAVHAVQRSGVRVRVLVSQSPQGPGVELHRDEVGRG